MAETSIKMDIDEAIIDEGLYSRQLSVISLPFGDIADQSLVLVTSWDMKASLSSTMLYR